MIFQSFTNMIYMEMNAYSMTNFFITDLMFALPVGSLSFQHQHITTLKLESPHQNRYEEGHYTNLEVVAFNLGDHYLNEYALDTLYDCLLSTTLLPPIMERHHLCPQQLQ
ncbi:hypothetical protein BDA99DRAFT_535756 [Phascolomyces articulosus]|uniref:Uncharacterized protein n=1 Tax=Phascolomyces articulosus TaxID=60185 RepID=A0AAD5KED6_9FUNG|nr:hypothetical protein BDA99DRAFT_535756 [Phascolomyces articulosus]